MNHSIAYSDFPPLTLAQEPSQETDQYMHIIAAMSDINLTLPSSRALRAEITSTRTHCELHIIHKEFVIHTYFLKKTPSIFRRFLTQITLGFAPTEQVELLKTEIESRYTYGERIIL